MLLTIALALASLADGPKPLEPLPSARQLAWHRLEYYAFIHFGPNTFTDREWGQGTESEKLFNPTDFDARQWARVAKAAGMKMIVLTCKHHDGFALWPSKYSKHTVAQSPWRGGKGDVVKEVSRACKESGLKFGIYVSPWDRNHPTYGTPEYNEVFNKMLTELLTQYGPVSEVWFDGANGEGPNGKRQAYDWSLFIGTVRKHAPMACIFSDAGPDIRWVGNEDGYAGETNWGMLHRDRFSPGVAVQSELNAGHADGGYWVPAECDVSIRPGWFYHAAEDERVKSVDKLLDIYFGSVGRGGNLILNVPPDRRGRWHENDVRALMGLRGRLDDLFKTDLCRGRPAAGGFRGKGYEAGKATDGKDESYWAAADGETGGALTVDLGKGAPISVAMLREPIALGQRVSSFAIEGLVDGEWKELAKGTTIGNKRLLRFPRVTATKIRLTILSARSCPAISTISLYD